ncbi:MAG: acVLRF1 family peptidyl-tRNA hydrolase [Dehalococcoidales bacterium]
MKKRILNRQATLEYLESLKGVPGKAAAFCLPPNLAPEETQGVCKLGEIPEDVHPHLIKLAAGSKTGCYVFWSAAQKCLVVPPFPATEKQAVQPLDLEQVRSQIERDLVIGLVLVRLGAYAVGVSRGEQLISSKVGTGLVHGRHRQGGSSAHRFERHRDKQIETFLNRVCEHVHETLGPYVKKLDYIVYGGARDTIQLLQKYCPLLMQLKTLVLPPLLDIPDPRQAVLEKAVSRVWSSTVVEFTE